MASRTSKVLALSLGQGLGMVVSLLTSIVFARRLTQEGLATYRQAFLAYSFVTPVLTLALPQALYFFLPRNCDRERSVVVTNVLMLTALGGLFSLALGLGGTRILAMQFNNPQLESVMQAFLVYPLIMFPASALSACLVAKERIVTLTIFTLVSQIVATIATAGACILRPDPRFLVEINVAVGMCALLPALALMSKVCSTGPLRLDPAMGWKMLKYTVPLGLSGLLGTLTLQLAGIIVSFLRSPSEFAVFSIGAVEVPLIGIVTGSISTVILADMARLCQARQYAAALELFRTAALRSAAILLPAMMFLLVAARPFIEGLYSPKYEGSVLVFQLYLLLLPVRIVYYSSALMALGRTKQVLWRSIGDFSLTGLLCVVFVHWIGYLGAVVALVTTIYLWTVPFNLFCIGRGFGVRMRDILPFSQLGRISAIVTIPAVVASAWRLVPNLPRLEQLGMAFLLYAPLAMILLWRGGFLPTDLIRGLPVAGPWFGRIEKIVAMRAPVRKMP